MDKDDYVIRVQDSPLEIDAGAWNALLAAQSRPTPFMRHEYLAALHTSGSAVPSTGWRPQYVTLSGSGGHLHAACPLYLKRHSRGEYVFDWAWADAYARHGLPYYPKAVVAVPFTPVPGTRLLADSEATRTRLVAGVRALCEQAGVSSLHLLFGAPDDLAACERDGMMLRQTVQFHWHNREDRPYGDFEDFLAALQQEKRKKIRQERRKVASAGVVVEARVGADITPSDWDFFYACYTRTYEEHGNPPYLTRGFFEALAATQPQHWVLFTACTADGPIACSLIAFDDQPGVSAAWGRYWGALARVDCLHFELCYYAPLQWCIARGLQRFEGGAQGEHKLARALLPAQTWSAHWIADERFAEAIGVFLARETEGVDGYYQELATHTPIRRGDVPG